MDFLSTIPDASRRVILTKVIGEFETEIYECLLMIGISPGDLAADYTAPVEPEGSETMYLTHRRVQSLNENIISCKAQLAALG